jgi:hypothetical protein
MPKFILYRLFSGGFSPISRMKNYLQSHFADVNENLLTKTLLEIALIQDLKLSSDLGVKIMEDLPKRKLIVVPEDGSKHVALNDEKMALADQLVINRIHVLLYALYGDVHTASNIARWVIRKIEENNNDDTIEGAVFDIEAVLRVDKKGGTRKGPSFNPLESSTAWSAQSEFLTVF